MGRNDQILFGVFCAALLALVMIAAASQNGGGNAAEWFAGIAGFCAIVGAVAISRSDGRTRKEETLRIEGQRAAAFAARMIPYLVRIENALQLIDQLNKTNQYGLDIAMHNVGDAIVRFSIPPLQDRELLDDLSALDVTTIQLTMAIVNIADEYGNYIQSAMPLARSMTPVDRFNYLGDMKRRIEALRRFEQDLLPRLQNVMDRAQGIH